MRLNDAISLPLLSLSLGSLSAHVLSSFSPSMDHLSPQDGYMVLSEPNRRSSSRVHQHGKGFHTNSTEKSWKGTRRGLLNKEGYIEETQLLKPSQQGFICENKVSPQSRAADSHPLLRLLTCSILMEGPGLIIPVLHSQSSFFVPMTIQDTFLAPGSSVLYWAGEGQEIQIGLYLCFYTQNLYLCQVPWTFFRRFSESRLSHYYSVSPSSRWPCPQWLLGTCMEGRGQGREQWETVNAAV